MKIVIELCRMKIRKYNLYYILSCVTYMINIYIATLSDLLWNLVNIAAKRNFSRHEMPSTNTKQPQSSFCVGVFRRGKATKKRSALASIYMRRKMINSGHYCMLFY